MRDAKCIQSSEPEGKRGGGAGVSVRVEGYLCASSAGQRVCPFLSCFRGWPTSPLATAHGFEKRRSASTASSLCLSAFLPRPSLSRNFAATGGIYIYTHTHTSIYSGGGGQFFFFPSPLCHQPSSLPTPAPPTPPTLPLSLSLSLLSFGGRFIFFERTNARACTSTEGGQARWGSALIGEATGEGQAEGGVSFFERYLR